MNEPILIGISLPGRFSAVLNRAVELLRERHPLADDATLLEMLLITGMAGVIDAANNARAEDLRRSAE
ncbi:MAG: hypothetical protein H3C26_16040 [Rhodocyclaceae bacterium]|nr:hypothetical protein [Rhodocyclaceae bacterium]